MFSAVHDCTFQDCGLWTKNLNSTVNSILIFSDWMDSNFQFVIFYFQCITNFIYLSLLHVPDSIRSCSLFPHSGKLFPYSCDCGYAIILRWSSLGERFSTDDCVKIRTTGILYRRNVIFFLVFLQLIWTIRDHVFSRHRRKFSAKLRVILSFFLIFFRNTFSGISP